MESVKIYLSGAMSSLSFDEQSKWRKQIMDAIRFGDYHYEKKPTFFNPVDYFNFEEIRHKSEREIMEFDLNGLRKSDLVIVNFNDPTSLGTCAELAIAYEMKIPIIGINKDGCDLHPWLIEFTSRMCNNIREAVEYTVDFYLN
ncbi:MAG: nucleoside 2-deoxyribosyltransferase domain-containing protein [bacterium]|nr:nucleoside 2-deoxyribosyltransferase domain-containing protein [bacterium]